MTSNDLVVKPLTPRLWPEFEDLLDQGGPAGRCWCMAWRIGPEYRRRPAEQNRTDFRRLVGQGPPPGLLALRDGLALGWCQVTPRESIPAIERQRRLRRVDDAPVWALSCLYVRKGYRRQGITSALIATSVDFGRAAGAAALEAYPLDGTVSPSATGTGYASTFAAAGFAEIARHSKERPIMRFSLSG